MENEMIAILHIVVLFTNKVLYILF